MPYVVRRGRLSGVLEIIYADIVTADVRWQAIGEGQQLMGSKVVPVAIIDFSAATLGMSRADITEFQTMVATSDGLDQTIAIYVAGPHKAMLLEEAAIGNALGRIVEVVDGIEDAYAFLAEMETWE